MKRLSISSVAIALMILVMGCSNKSSEPLIEDNPNFTEEFGGYTATDEEPGFGDAALVASEGEEEIVVDDYESLPDVVDLLSNPEAGIFHLQNIWGQLRYDSANTTPTDWAGSISTTRGVLLIRRLIRFEPATDYLEPRADRKSVEWVSQTTVHNDGIAVDLLLPPELPIIDTTWSYDGVDSSIVSIDTILVEPVMLTFETGPYSQTFSLEELASLDTVVYVDADSNAVAFHGFQWYQNSCPRGFLAGRWGYDQDGTGVFAGLWRDRSGYMAGYVRGHYGLNAQGVAVFFGKWITRAGKFAGFLRGNYGPLHHASNAAGNTGWFAGDIYNGEKDPIGRLRGLYGTDQFFPGGWHLARWKLFCPNENGNGNGNGTGNVDDGF